MFDVRCSMFDVRHSMFDSLCQEFSFPIQSEIENSQYRRPFHMYPYMEIFK